MVFLIISHPYIVYISQKTSMNHHNTFILYSNVFSKDIRYLTQNTNIFMKFSHTENKFDNVSIFHIGSVIETLYPSKVKLILVRVYWGFANSMEFTCRL